MRNPNAEVSLFCCFSPAAASRKQKRHTHARACPLSLSSSLARPQALPHLPPVSPKSSLLVAPAAKRVGQQGPRPLSEPKKKRASQFRSRGTADRRPSLISTLPPSLLKPLPFPSLSPRIGSEPSSSTRTTSNQSLSTSQESLFRDPKNKNKKQTRWCSASPRCSPSPCSSSSSSQAARPGSPLRQRPPPRSCALRRGPQRESKVRPIPREREELFFSFSFFVALFFLLLLPSSTFPPSASTSTSLRNPPPLPQAPPSATSPCPRPSTRPSAATKTSSRPSTASRSATPTAGSRTPTRTRRATSSRSRTSSPGRCSTPPRPGRPSARPSTEGSTSPSLAPRASAEGGTTTPTTRVWQTRRASFPCLLWTRRTRRRLY